MIVFVTGGMWIIGYKAWAVPLGRALVEPPFENTLVSFWDIDGDYVSNGMGGLEPGAQAVVPAGWRNGLVMLVLHCEAPDDFSLAVVSAADGLAHQYCTIHSDAVVDDCLRPSSNTASAQ